jgi:hypothetical protein
MVSLLCREEALHSNFAGKFDCSHISFAVPKLITSWFSQENKVLEANVNKALELLVSREVF